MGCGWLGGDRGAAGALNAFGRASGATDRFAVTSLFPPIVFSVSCLFDCSPMLILPLRLDSNVGSSKEGCLASGTLGLIGWLVDLAVGKNNAWLVDWLLVRVVSSL